MTTRIKRWVLGAGEVQLEHMGAASVGSTQLVDGAVTSGKYANNSIPEVALGNLSVSTRTIAATAVTDAKLADAAVVERCYAAGSIPTAAYKTNSIPAAAYGDLSIANAKITNATIDLGAKAVAGSATTAVYADGSVTAAKLSFGPVAQGLHTTWVPARAVSPTDTSGGTPGVWKSLSSPNNKPTIPYISFSAASPESADFSITMPKSWNAGAFLVKIHWMHPTTSVDFQVRWQVRVVAIGASDVVDTTFGSFVGTTATGGGADREWVSSAISISPALAQPEDRVYFQIERDTAHVDDTLAVAAYMTGVTVLYTIDKPNDA